MIVRRSLLATFSRGLPALLSRGLPATLLAAPALAQQPALAPWPDRPITVVVPYAPAGATDIIARLMAPHLQTALGQPVVIENRGGAATRLGTEAVARARPDGNTLLLTAAPLAINVGLFPNLGYDPVRDFAPITMVMTNPQVLVVRPDGPADVAALLAAARQKPGGLNFGSAAPGSMGHLSMELLASRSGAALTHVAYRSSAAALTDLLSGTLDGMFDNPSTALPLVRDGKLRAIAFTGPTRSAAAPEVPTMVEQGFAGFTTLNWYGLFAPVGTPAPIIARLNAAATAALRRPEIVARLAADGTEATPGAPEVLGAWVAREVALWSALIRERGISAE